MNYDVVRKEAKTIRRYLKKEFPDFRAFSYVDRACLNANLAELARLERILAQGPPEHRPN